jgi:tetratricopeptide (TPR) repeat protein
MFSTRKQDLRIWILAILAISLALSITACGGRHEPEVTPATPTSKPAEPSPTPTPVPTQDTENAEAHLEAAATFYAAGEYDKAVIELEKAIELEPDNAEAHTNLALSYFKNGDYENAVAAWTEVIKFNPDEAGPYYERGTSYFNLKKYESAIADLTQAIDLDPTNADAYRVRGKSHAFMENYEQAIADFSQAIELDPTSDEAYFNRAVSTTKIGKSKNDLANIIADYGMVLHISENPDLREQAQKSLETLMQNNDDPALLQQAADALQGKVTAPAVASDTGAEPSLMDIDINRAPGHSIGFENHLEPGGSQRFLFLASPGDTIGAGIASASNMLIGIQNAQTGQVLGTATSNDNSLLVTIPQNALYHIVIEDAGGQGGDYVAAFEASPQVSFALDPNYFIIGRLPQGGLLYYTYTAPGGATLQGNVIPHPDTPVDLVVKILDLDSRATLFEANQSGPGENEQFTFTVPDSGDDKLMTYIVTIEDSGHNKGAYILTITSDAPIEVAPATSPESVVQAVFDAAKSGDFAPLKELCDPLGENDGDTQMICDMATDDTNREEFVQYFATGKISGEASISPQGDRAEVPFLFGPDGEREETMELINRDGQWYLFGF